MLMLQAGCDAEGDAETASGCPVLLFSCTLILSKRVFFKDMNWSGINSRGGIETDCCYHTATNRCCCWFFFFFLSNPLSNRIVSDCVWCYFSEGKGLRETKWFGDSPDRRKARTCACLIRQVSGFLSEVLPSSNSFPGSDQNTLWNKHLSNTATDHTHAVAFGVRPRLFSCCLHQIIWMILFFTPVCLFWLFACKSQYVRELQFGVTFGGQRCVGRLTTFWWSSDISSVSWWHGNH